MKNKPARSVYEVLTERILEQMAQGIIPWHKPWAGTQGATCYNLVTGSKYSLLNQYILGKPGGWITYKQATEIGGNVKKGEKASYVFFWKPLPIEVEDELTGEKKLKTVWMFRYYQVFHETQCEGIEKLTAKYKKDEEPKPTMQPIEAGEIVVREYAERSKVHIERSMISNEAFYSIASDSIVVPNIEKYEIVEEYYSTLFHEMGHSTGAEHRLNRKIRNRRGNDDYAREELVAEMTAAFLCNHCGMDSDKCFDNSVAYLQDWSKRIKDDSKLFAIAAANAEKATKYILTGELPKREE